MSRFDLFFVVLDDCNEVVDTHIAERIVRVHQQKDAALQCDFSVDSIQKYIRYTHILRLPAISNTVAGMRARSSQECPLKFGNFLPANTFSCATGMQGRTRLRIALLCASLNR